jgi:hypothetical protein
MTLRSVWLGNKYECRHKLISAQFGKVNLNLERISEPNGEKPALTYDYTFPVHITLILHLTYEPLVLDYGTF